MLRSAIRIARVMEQGLRNAHDSQGVKNSWAVPEAIHRRGYRLLADACKECDIHKILALTVEEPLDLSFCFRPPLAVWFFLAHVRLP